MKKKFKVHLLIESSRAAGRDLLKGIARYARLHGDWSFYWETGGLEANVSARKSLDVDGIISRDLTVSRALMRRTDIPAVVVGHRDREARGLINVLTDSQAVGRMAAEHLLNCGFKHFAFCGLARMNHEQTPWSGERMKSFAARIQAARFAAPEKFVLHAHATDWKSSRRRLADWLMKLPRPVGILACNDDCGAQVAEACKLAGLAVPDEAGLVGVDNDEVVCGLSDPPMSSVALNFEQAGYAAARALDRLMRGGRQRPADIIVAPTHLVTRRSTDAVAVDDERVGRALRFIRNHTRQPFSVNEVAAAAGVSRRALERRFRETMGVSLLQEIRRARTDEIARLLLETNLPVAEIAGTLGFGDSQHIARYFYAAKKTSPLAFRRRQGKPAH